MELIRANQYDYLINQIKKYVILDTPIFPCVVGRVSSEEWCISKMVALYQVWWAASSFRRLMIQHKKKLECQMIN